MQGHKKWSCIGSSIHSRTKWPTSLWHPFRPAGPNWNRASWDSLGQDLPIQNVPLNLRWWHSQRNCQSSGGSVGELASTQDSIMHPCDHKAQDRVCLVGLMPLISSHTGDLWAILYQVQDVQVTTICLNGVFEGGLLHSTHCYCSDSVVGV